MNNRLLDIIKYKTGGRQKPFAKLLGWTPQYLAKLLRGENFGLQPVLTLLEKLPEVNARWLLLGQGEMLTDDKLATIRREALSRMQGIMEFEKYLSVMSPDELRRYEDVLQFKASPDFTEEDVNRWNAKLTSRQKTLDEKIEDAISQSLLR